MITIKKATQKATSEIAELMLYAMRGIVYDFIGEENDEKAKQFLKDLIGEENNQYSYQNTFIATLDDLIVGSFTLYDGQQLEMLRKPVLAKIKAEFGREIILENETSSGELYIDTIAVYPEHRGKGFGNSILDFITREFGDKENQTLGLLVDFENPKAQQLYESKGFKKVGEKKLLHTMNNHMQYKKGA